MGYFSIQHFRDFTVRVIQIPKDQGIRRANIDTGRNPFPFKTAVFAKIALVSSFCFRVNEANFVWARGKAVLATYA